MLFFYVPSSREFISTLILPLCPQVAGNLAQICPVLCYEDYFFDAKYLKILMIFSPISPEIFKNIVQHLQYSLPPSIIRKTNAFFFSLNP